MARQMQRRGTAADMAAANETPQPGEIYLETDTGKTKFGDGSTAYNSLPYATDPSVITTVATLTPLTQTEGTLVDGATINWDVTTDPNAKVILGGNRTLATPSNMIGGRYHTIRIIQDGTGGRTLGFSSGYKFPSGMLFTWSPGANAVDIYQFYCDGTNMNYIARGFNFV